MECSPRTSAGLCALGTSQTLLTGRVPPGASPFPPPLPESQKCLCLSNAELTPYSVLTRVSFLWTPSSGQLEGPPDQSPFSGLCCMCPSPCPTPSASFLCQDGAPTPGPWVQPQTPPLTSLLQRLSLSSTPLLRSLTAPPLAPAWQTPPGPGFSVRTTHWALCTCRSPGTSSPHDSGWCGECRLPPRGLFLEPAQMPMEAPPWLLGGLRAPRVMSAGVSADRHGAPVHPHVLLGPTTCHLLSWLTGHALSRSRALDSIWPLNFVHFPML